MTRRRSPLGALWDSVTAANGWSTRDVEKRILDRDGQLGRSNMNRIVNQDPLMSISANAIYSLAAGLAISPTRVAVAAMESMGIPMATDEITPAEAIMRDPDLDEATRSILLTILREATSRRGERGA